MSIYFSRVFKDELRRKGKGSSEASDVVEGVEWAKFDFELMDDEL